MAKGVRSERLLKLRSVPSLLPEVIANSISIVGIGALSALGQDIEMHFRAISRGQAGLRRLSELWGNESPLAENPAAWIAPRELLTHRKWSPASMAALHVAKEAVAGAGWMAGELADAALVVGTSRGNAAGWLGEWPGRRPFKLMAASNTIHSEPATAVSIECGIYGPNHVVSSGCSAGLDALGLAKMLLDSGQATRALVVAVDLPLVPLLLDNYAASGLLGSSEKLNPFSAHTDGFVPGEGAAAIALSKEERGKVEIGYFSNNSDGRDPVGVPKDGGRSPELIAGAVKRTGLPSAICPHATGTKVQARAERMIFQEAFRDHADISFHLLKPYFGHTIGASGLLESAVLARFMAESQLPPNLKGTGGPGDWPVPDAVKECGGPVFKLAHGMGGHNALAVFLLNL
ncbi:beta-ketoacyl synthase N-terminal-like domain-containing protein [Luteolibacter algae]|uniref:Beta-ketoacyl synthase N-terminal-like domain-containing protein n=1 Tax=Luteolibacter algae TaxID=454151 RepID=A0ABW5D3P4_9BACT